MSSSGRYLQGEPAQAVLVYSGVLRVLSRTQPPSVPEVNWEETAALSAAGKRPGWGQASKQPTEHPTFRVLSIFVTSHTTSRVTVTASSHTTTIMIIFLSKLVFKNIVFIIQISD